jgi:hypothetical protein
MVQIDGPSRQVFIKFESADHMATHLPDTLGTREYLHTSGELSKVIVSTSGIGYREIRIAGLLPEVPDSVLKVALFTYGDIRGYCRQSWSKQYRYQKSNGVRVVTILLKKRVPSVLTIAGTRTLISYDEQEMTCFTCHEHGHISKLCPHKRSAQPTLQPLRPVGHPLTWAQVLREERLQVGDSVAPPSVDVATPAPPTVQVTEPVQNGAISWADDIPLPVQGIQHVMQATGGSEDPPSEGHPPHTDWTRRRCSSTQRQTRREVGMYRAGTLPILRESLTKYHKRGGRHG